MRRLIPMLILGLLAACGGEVDDVESTAPPAGPEEVAAEWLAAVADGDTVALEDLVEPVGLAVIAAVENNLRSDELVGLLENGITGELANGYWASFRDDFAAIRGQELLEISIGGATPVPGVDQHTAVAIESPSTTGNLVLIHSGSGWQVDFVATVGPALIGPLGAYLESALAGANAQEIAAAYASAVVPGLEAALALDPENSNLEFETEYIRQLSAV